MASKAFVEFCSLHYSDPQNQRLGQHFYNLYFKSNPWPELFYGKDEDTRWMIQNWLNNHHYFNELPPVLERGVPNAKPH